MGHIVGPFGILGWVKVLSYTETIDGLLDYSTWWLDKGNDKWLEIKVTEGRVNGNTLVVKLEGYVDRTAATQLKGTKISIPREHLPSLPESGINGYYWSDLIGATVVNLQQEELGKVSGLLKTGANDVLQIQNEKLIPFIDQVIIKVDLKSRRITVNWGVDY